MPDEPLVAMVRRLSNQNVPIAGCYDARDGQMRQMEQYIISIAREWREEAKQLREIKATPFPPHTMLRADTLENCARELVGDEQ